MRDANIARMIEPTFRIVVALDLEQYSQIVLDHALDQAARHRAPDIHFLSVVERPADVPGVKDQLATLVLPSLDSIASTEWSARLHVRSGDAAEEIAGLAGELRAHLIVIGRFGVHHPHRHIGKSASDIIDLAPCPVLAVGLVDDAPELSPQCEDCVKIRRDTHGGTWFCMRHRGDRARISTLVPFGSNFTGSRLMW
jgi:nucleotide-binding universal stress UspA family protein